MCQKRSVDKTDGITDSLTRLTVQMQGSFKARNDWYFFGMGTMVMLVLSYKPPISLHIQTNMFNTVCNCTAGTDSICSTNMQFH